MSLQPNAYKKAPRGIVAVFFDAGEDAIAEGEPLVRDASNGSAYVARPTANTDEFVGVAARSYPADSGARQIQVYLPGSKNIKIRVAHSGISAGAVVAFGYTASTGAKVFKAAGSPHAMSALAIGDAIVREANATASSSDLLTADLAMGPYTAGTSV